MRVCRRKRMSSFHRGHNDVFDDDEEDNALDLFPENELLVTSYGEDKNMDDEFPLTPLFIGSDYTAKNLARFLFALKARHRKMGDGMFASIVGMVATFLPHHNVLQKVLDENSSQYFLLKSIDNLAQFDDILHTVKVHCCIKGCHAFYRDKALLNFCPKCHECRWKQCDANCYEDGQKVSDIDIEVRLAEAYFVSRF
jgi:hypothetical protein